MITVNLYLRKDCHLCEQLLIDLNEIQSKFPHKINEIDIDQDPALYKKYFSEIPVLEVGPYTLRAPISQNDLIMVLGAATDAKNQVERIKSYSNIKPTKADLISLWITKHWLKAILVFFVLYLGLPVLAPVLMKENQKVPAAIIYTAYSPLCHELGFRSFFIFGEQPFYPRASANVPDYLTFNQATGINESDLAASRAFTGNSKVGYKIALCQRDVAIYAAIILFCVIFGLAKHKIPPLHWAIWLLVAIFPMALDGFSQLLSQLPIQGINAFLPFHESTPFQRVATGFLFGFGTAWFGIPYIEESMRETQAMLLKIFPRQMK